MHESGDQRIEESCAGALSNTLEAMQREAAATSLDTAEAGAAADEGEGEGEGGAGGGGGGAGVTPRKKGKGKGLLSAFGEKPTEIELSEEVLEVREEWRRGSRPLPYVLVAFTGAPRACCCSRRSIPMVPSDIGAQRGDTST